jgi:hypothetical protein
MASAFHFLPYCELIISHPLAASMPDSISSMIPEGKPW